MGIMEAKPGLSKGEHKMKREQVILGTMTDVQLDATKKLVDREIKRRSSVPAARRASSGSSSKSKKSKRPPSASASA